MFIINPLEFLLQMEFTQYIFGGFAFFGIMLCLKMFIFGRR